MDAFRGGVLSPLLRCLVLNSFVHLMNKEGNYAQAYADNLVVILDWKFVDKVMDLTWERLNTINNW